MSVVISGASQSRTHAWSIVLDEAGHLPAMMFSQWCCKSLIENSARKPSLPKFTPTMGICRCTMARACPSMVPSPPRIIARSAFGHSCVS